MNKHVLSVNTLTDLKAFKGDDNLCVMLLGKMMPGDGQGGLYRWVIGSSTDSLIFLDTIMVTGVSDGYWQRIYLSAKTLPQGTLVSTGGVKTLYASGTTNSSGEVTLNLTEDNTATGVALFSSILSIIPSPTTDASGPANAVQSYRKSLAVNLKTTTYGFYKANAITIALGLLYNPFASVGAGITINFRIDGI